MGKRGLCRLYFFAWKKRLREKAAMKFLEVQVTEPVPSAATDSRVEIGLFPLTALLSSATALCSGKSLRGRDP